MTGKVTRNGVFLVLVCLSSAALIIYSVLFIYGNYMVPLYWDQWEFAVDLAKSKHDTLSLGYLFAAHNEHVIATTKLIFFLDYYFFNLTNGPLVFTIGLATLCIAWLLAKILFVSDNEDKIFYVFFMVFAASGFSLAQWENLLWGFQPQFYLALIFALLSCLLGLKVSDPERRGSAWWFVALVVTTGLGVFSMGNGIALPVSIMILMVLRRYRPIKTVLYALFAALLVGAFMVLTRGSVPIGDPALKTAGNLVIFFFGMLGSPISSNGFVAAIFGLVLFGAYSILFLVYILIPFLRSRPLDAALIGLFTFASFLFATAVGAAWGRTALGVGASLASRYSTPMLVLWMTLFAILFRVTILSNKRASLRQIQTGGWILVALSVAAWSSMRPENVVRAEAQTSVVNQAGYFLSSGVIFDEQLLKLYPLADRIRPVVTFLRDAKLNVFAEGAESSLLNSKPWMDKAVQACEFGNVDRVQRLSATAWQAVGWASNSKRQTPKWIVAVDADKGVLGYSAPLQTRADVVKSIQASKTYRGFIVPINASSLNLADAGQSVSLFAIFGGNEAPCRMALPPLPNAPYLIKPGELVQLPANIVRSGATASPGIPTMIPAAPPYKGAEINGTWVSSDGDVGDVTYNILDTTCRDVIVPIMRGPSAEGLSLIIKSNGRHVYTDTTILDQLQPHLWRYLQIDAFDICKVGEKLSLSITLEDKGSGWGSWGAMATPAVQP